MDWDLVVRTQEDAHPNGDRMETDAREYLEAKKDVALQQSTTWSTPYLRDPPFRLVTRIEQRSLSPSLVLPRQEKTVPLPMVYRRPAPANTSSNPVLKDYIL